MTVLDSYVSELDASLRGGRRRKRDLLREAHDHLIDAADAHERAGASRADAERRAVREFGDARDIAPGYQAILSVEKSRTLGIWLLLAVAVQPFAWGYWNTTSYGSEGSSQTLDELNAYIETAGLAVVIFATIATIGCGIAVRFIGVRERMLRFSLTSALVSSVIILVVSVLMLLAGSHGSFVSWLFITVVVWVPMTSIATASVRGLRSLGDPPEGG